MNTKHFLRVLIAILSLAVAVPASAQCTGDLNVDGRVDGGDLGTTLAWWGPVLPTNPISVACDFDGSGRVDGADLGVLLSNWGVCVGSITSVAPLEGCAAGGTVITINGTFLDFTSAVSVGGTPCTEVIVRSATQVEAVVPSGVPGSAVIRLTTGAGAFEAPLAFSYSPASIANVSPNQGCVIGGTPITILGSCLAGVTSVTVGGMPCTNLVVVSSTQVNATTPAGTAGQAEVRAISLHSSATSAQNFVFMPPAVTAVVPNVGSAVGGTTITITGSYLGLTSNVRLGGIEAANVTVVDANTVTAITPVGNAGAVDLELQGPKGSVTVPGGFRYMTPSVSSVTPVSGPTVGGTRISITGTWLGGVNTVVVGGELASEIVVVDANHVTARTPVGLEGDVDVLVSGADGSATIPSGFQYQSLVVPAWATLIEATPDPEVVTNPTLRAAIAASGYAWRVRDNGTGIEMLLIPQGTFTMGCTASEQSSCYSEESPTHTVTLTNAFYIGRYEVTQSQWHAKMGSNPSYFRSYPDSAIRPVEKVSWNTIQGYLGATGMRLPSEAEWEYACRAGTTTAFNNGSSNDATVGTIAWYFSNSGDQTHVVGGKAANALGLYDMSGNVYEWVNDWYGAYSSGAQTNPLGPVSGTSRVVRGGSWFYYMGDVRSSYRAIDYAPGDAVYDVGFRVARAP